MSEKTQTCVEKLQTTYVNILPSRSGTEYPFLTAHAYLTEDSVERAGVGGIRVGGHYLSQVTRVSDKAC